MNGENGMARRVPRRRQRDNAGRDFLAGLELRHLLGDIGKNPPLVEKSDFQIGRCCVEVGVIHPIGPFRRGHHDVGVGKDQRVVLVLDAVDMVGMEMRDDDRVDFFWVDARSRKIVAQHAGRRRDLASRAGIEEHEPLAGIDDECGEWRRQFVMRHKRCIERVLDLRKRRVDDEFVVDRSIPDAVIERGELIRADLVAVNPGRCGTGRRRFGARAIAGGRKRCRRGAGKKITLCQFRHSHSLFATAAPLRACR